MPEPLALENCELKLVDPDRVRSVQASLPENDVVEKLAEVFGLLSDPNRLRLLASMLELECEPCAETEDGPCGMDTGMVAPSRSGHHH